MKKWAYYNEIDPYAAQWIRNLIAAGHIAPGEVDERSIEDVCPDDVKSFVQCHWFAGIAGWAYALDLAGWPRDRPVWTGSCPCQPFSAAGKGAGFEDERHLWPAWQHLINQCRPPVIFGEQVASKAVDAWIDLVHTDMEGMGYAFGSVPFPAAGVGAPHIRDRTYWVADSEHDGRDRPNRAAPITDRNESDERIPDGDCPAGGLADASSAGSLPGALAGIHRGEDGTRSRHGELERPRADGGVGHANGAGLEGHTGHGGAAGRQGSRGSVAQAGLFGGVADTNSDGCESRDGIRLHGEKHDVEHGGSAGIERPGPTNGFWRDADWLRCTDGKWRPVEPGTFPLAHGVPKGVVRGSDSGEPFHPAEARVARLRGYGNAIIPAQAAHFILASQEAIHALQGRGEEASEAA